MALGVPMTKRPGRFESQQDGRESCARGSISGSAPRRGLGSRLDGIDSQPAASEVRTPGIRWAARSRAADSGVELRRLLVNALLTKPVDSRKTKPDEARRAARNPREHPTAGPSPRAARWSGTSKKRTRALRVGRTPAVASCFRQGRTKDGRETALRSVEIRAIAATEWAADSSDRTSASKLDGLSPLRSYEAS